MAQRICLRSILTEVRSATDRPLNSTEWFSSGVVNVRSHTKTHVLNKLSRHQRTTGQEERHLSTDNNSKESSSALPINSSSNLVNGHGGNASRAKRAHHECIFSTALTLIRQPTEHLVSGFNMDSVCLATIFGLSRGFLNPEEMISQQEQSPRPCGSLFVISWHGRLIEYVLEPMAGTSNLRLSFVVVALLFFRHDETRCACHTRDAVSRQSNTKSTMVTSEV